MIWGNPFFFGGGGEGILFKKNDTKFKFEIKLRALEEASQVRGRDI